MENIETIEPKDKNHWLKERTKDITSTDVSALFGLSPYCTEAELWHQKKNHESGSFEPTERMVWGNRLESAIAHGVAEDNGWQVEPFKVYLRRPAERIGSSFDFQIMPDGGILEIKNVDFLQMKDKWIIDDDNIEAPPHIELQIQHQLLVSKRPYAYLAALVSGNTPIVTRRTVNPRIAKQIIEKAGQFWESIEANRPPAFDFDRDADFVTKLYSRSEKGKVIEASPEIEHIVREYKKAQVQEKEAKTQKDAAKAKLLTFIDDAEKVISNGFSISAGQVEGKSYTVNRKPFRNFRISYKKGFE